MSTLSKIYRLLAVIAVSLLTLGSQAQDRTLFNMRQLPQSSLLNPAVQPEGSFFMTFPGYSSFQVGFSNNGFSYHDLIHKETGPQKDSLVLDIENLESKLKDINYLRQDFSYDILHFGFKVKEMYFTFGMSAKQTFRFGYPKDIVSIKNGNWNPLTNETKDIKLSGLTVDGTAYGEISLGISREINSKLTVGIRPKLLLGSMNMTSTKSDILLHTNADGTELTANTDVEMNVSAPMKVKRDAQDNFDEADFSQAGDDVMKNFVFTGNNGYAIDLGLTYKLSDSLVFSASLVDFGLINWKNNTFKLYSKGTYKTDGTDITSEFRDNSNSVDPWEQLGDTLESIFKPKDVEGKKYKSYLNPKIYLAANYNLNDKIGFGILSRNEIIHGNLIPELTFSVITNPSRFFSFNLSYSLMSRTYDHVGAGMSLRLGGMQLYFVSDNVTAAIYPHKRRAADIRFGANLVFGVKKKKTETQVKINPSESPDVSPVAPQK
jgi:hypothetical protein